MNNIKTYLQEKQSIVYQIIKNTFQNNKLTHAYIINGSKGAPLLQTAQFIAQSLICENKDENNLACLQCVTCQRIISNNYVDCLYYKGEDLKKDQVLYIQKEFNKSSIEKANKQIYIVDEIEKAPVASLNKLLKFIEEPQSNIVAIFTTHSLSSIIQTIVSRCQVITLKQFSFEELKKLMLDTNPNLDVEDVNLLCKVSNDLEKNLKIIEDENFSILKEVLFESLNYLIDKSDMLIVYMQTNGISKLSEIGYTEMYLDLLEISFMEALIYQNDPTEEIILKEYLEKLSKTYDNLDRKIIEVMKTKQELISNTNVSLAFDKLFINLLRG